jgi:ribosomal-protein-alanine N-acetyltransferase
MELKGSKFIIRNWRLGDAESLQKHADNFNVSKYLTDRFPYPYTMEKAVEWVESKLSQEPLINFAIIADDKVIGGIGIEFRGDVYRKAPLLGYWLGEPFWGSGIMTEAVKLITAYAFNNLDIICIHATVLGNNPNSMHVLEKVGYVKQGVLKQCVIKNDEVLDEHVYAAYR